MCWDRAAAFLCSLPVCVSISLEEAKVTIRDVSNFRLRTCVCVSIRRRKRLPYFFSLLRHPIPHFSLPHCAPVYAVSIHRYIIQKKQKQKKPQPSNIFLSSIRYRLRYRVVCVPPWEDEKGGDLLMSLRIYREKRAEFASIGSKIGIE